MRISVYESFPSCAKEIREAVFRAEQGFQNEFDETDPTATHFVLFNEEELPIATCRVFWNETMNTYTLGRLAVIKKYRGKNIGSAIVREAENYVRENGGKSIALHSQCQAAGFYQKLGYKEFGTVENEEGCPHIWMRKLL
ncbi:MAG: GNAT family N-acetyltransferase [Lachnospiraceae bacterium]|nr:GNAT family N-acetyltransferase [Lachnospiraceae bacterium]